MAGPTTIDWGDGSPVETGPEKGTASHAYATDGTKTIKVCDAAAPTVCTTTEVTIPFPSTATPTVTAAADPADTTGRTAAITLAGFPADGAVNVNWGDGTAAQALPAGTTTASHAYAAGVDGAQTISATSATDTTKTASTTFTPTPAAPAPAVAAAADAGDATGHTANITLTGFPADSAVSVNWGDGTAAEEIAAGTTAGSHVYAAGVTTEQTITATSVGDASKTASTTFTPGGAGLRAAARKK
ncbi:hypothetical protein ACFU98_10600 [Streptomyces sp. NPDC057575]|uniref:hypothetical protein n=1 Tax=unclassified Streptomyces TaxID=2593676 RepID=UPI003685A8E2